MAWDKPDAETVSFECDTCGAVEDCNIERVKAGCTESSLKGRSDFGICWKSLESQGWKSLKRTGRDWAYHCRLCANAAEAAHREGVRNDAERERLKARNAQ